MWFKVLKLHTFWFLTPETNFRMTTPAMDHVNPVLPGLSPVADKYIVARFEVVSRMWWKIEGGVISG